jgi:crotonobetainyl-CoA:carnitine CoA-transferase CaiB-like acyl-CoA transferase
MDAPLADVLVADLTQNVAGPYCTQILGDLGADVVKIERTGRGDDARAWAPPYWGEESATFMAVNRSKRSLAVDLKMPDGRAIVERLLARADVFVQSLHAGAADGLGLGWERAREINPRLVYCSVTAFGTEGPLRDRPGYDPLMQAYGGIMSITGHPGAAPARVPVSLVDMGTGLWAVTAILGGLRERDRTGRGTHVTTALFDTALAWTAFQTNQYLGTGEVPTPQGSGTAMICPYEAFPARDAWVMIAAGSDALFVKACEALATPALAQDPRFRDNPSRVAHRKALVDARARLGERARAPAGRRRAVRPHQYARQDPCRAADGRQRHGDARQAPAAARLQGAGPADPLGRRAVRGDAGAAAAGRAHRGGAGRARLRRHHDPGPRETSCRRTIRPSTSRARPTTSSLRWSSIAPRR